MLKQVLSTIKKIGRGKTATPQETGTSSHGALLAAMADRDFLEIAINTIKDVFLIFDPEGRLLGYNEYAKSLSGYDDEELMMKPLGVLTCPEDEAQKIKESFRRALEGDISKIDTILLRKDGSQLPIEYWCTPLQDREENVIGIIVLGRDLTERMRIEDKLRITQFEVDNALDLIMRVAPDGRISYLNDTACNLLGHSREEMMASFIWQSPLSIKEHEWQGVWARRAQLFPNRRETEVSLRDGSNISLDLSLGIFSFKNEEHLVIFGRDITRHKTMEEELNQANRELEIFARTVTHDIMAPLSAVSIVGESVEKLLRSGFEKENVHLAREMIVTLREGIADAVGLANEVVSLSQVRPLPGTIEPVSVSRVVNRVTAQLGTDIASKGVELKVDHDLGEVFANPTHVYQLFSNLISNAVKYGTNDHPVIRISRLESSAEGIHRFRVLDNGPGIKEEELEAVFQPFFRSTSGGTGLGLATVQKVVKLYGGDIAVHNDGGACFEFTLRDAYPDTD
jgi:PAS domain S-box-containing protein